MKQALITVFIVAFTGGVLLAQQAQQTQPADTGAAPAQTQAPAAQPQAPAPQQAPPSTSAPGAAQDQNAGRIAPGSIIPARLTKTVDAKKVKPGDEVVATVPGDLKATSGEVLVPKDTKVIGRVTEAQPRSKDQKESQLGIAFNQMTMKDGQQVQVPMSIQAIIAPPNRNSGAGSNEPPAGTSGSANGNPSGAGGRAGGMGGNYPQAPTAPQAGGSAPGAQTPSNSNPPITENTKGVVGIPNLTLSPAQNATTGAVVTSEKNNVKLEDGTMLLLRVNPTAQQNQQTPQSPQQ